MGKAKPKLIKSSPTASRPEQPCFALRHRETEVLPGARWLSKRSRTDPPISGGREAASSSALGINHLMHQVVAITGQVDPFLDHSGVARGDDETIRCVGSAD